LTLAPRLDAYWLPGHRVILIAAPKLLRFRPLLRQDGRQMACVVARLGKRWPVGFVFGGIHSMVKKSVYSYILN
jgi:hypothetical protein